MALFTKNGKPLQVSGEMIYSLDGVPVGRIEGRKVFGPNGNYVGTLEGDRLVYRHTDSASISSPFSVANIGGSGHGQTSASGIWGDEPIIPD